MEIFNPNGYSNVTVVKVPKNEISRLDFELCKQPRETLNRFYDRKVKKPNILMNAGFFSLADGSTCFTFVDENQTISEMEQYNTGMGVVSDSMLIFGDLNDRTDWRDFISAYPVLIKDGKAVKIQIAQEINYAARRSIIGYDADNVYLIAVEGKGMNFSGCQKMLLSLKLLYAINLDGGGSTKILHDGKSITSVAYNRAVDSVVAIYLKDKEEEKPVEPEKPEKVIYRVQVGAFSKSANAERMRDEIRSLPDTIGAGYARAYVRKINGLYKVQVGAFSVQANARRVVSNLKKFGYNAFITSA